MEGCGDGRRTKNPRRGEWSVSQTELVLAAEVIRSRQGIMGLIRVAWVVSWKWLALCDSRGRGLDLSLPVPGWKGVRRRLTAWSRLFPSARRPAPWRSRGRCRQVAGQVVGWVVYALK